MRKSIEQRALAACQSYVMLSREIKDLAPKIGDAISLCPLHPETHLSCAYGRDEEGDFMSIAEKETILSDCEHCKKADEHIQKRKLDRRKLASVKSEITRIGKMAVKP